MCGDVMPRGLQAKFSQERMKKLLMDTGTKLIAECNGKDEYWGTGYYMDNPLSNNKDTWPVRNRLGSLLM